MEADPFHKLLEMSSGYTLSRCLHVVADLGVADVLDDGPRPIADLASRRPTPHSS